MTYRWRWRLSCASALASTLLVVGKKARESTLWLRRDGVPLRRREGSNLRLRIYIRAMHPHATPLLAFLLSFVSVARNTSALCSCLYPHASPGYPILMFSLSRYIFFAFLFLNINIPLASALAKHSQPTSIAVLFRRSTHAYSSVNGAYLHGSIVRSILSFSCLPL